MQGRSGGWILLAASMVACAHRAPTPPAEGAPSSDTVSPPLTLDEFRAAFPVGTSILMRFVEIGMPPMEERWTWIAVDEEGSTVSTLSCDDEGKLLSEYGVLETTW